MTIVRMKRRPRTEPRMPALRPISNRSRARRTGEGVHLSAYVGADPINFTDPLGLIPPAPGGSSCPVGEIMGPEGCEPPPIEIWGRRLPQIDWDRYLLPIYWNLEDAQQEIVIVARRRWRDVSDLIKGVRSNACSALSKLPENGRIRLGAVVMGFGGLGGAAGAGVFVDSTGRFGSDHYYGWGAGFGFVGGWGVSVGNDAPAGGRTVSNHAAGGIGGGPVSVSGTYSKQSGGSFSGGVSLGQKLGYAAGGLHQTTNVEYSRSYCP